MSDAWADLPPSSYQADGAPASVFFLARMLGEKGSLRVAPRARPWQPGEKLDETGPNADEFTLELLFHNDLTEPGTEQQQHWPSALEELIRQFKTGKTATFHAPWKRNLRVKPLTWDRRASSEEHRGGELCTVVLKTDNEDNLDREAFEAVSVKASAQGTVEEATFDLESIGGWDGSIADLQEFASNLAGLLAAPDEFAQSILTAAKRLRRAVLTVTQALSTRTPGRDKLNDPEGASARAKLLDLLELAARAEQEARAHLPRTRVVTFDRVRDIWTIATELGQSARELMGLNGHIEDFAVIEPGVPVHVFA